MGAAPLKSICLSLHDHPEVLGQLLLPFLDLSLPMFWELILRTQGALGLRETCDHPCRQEYSMLTAIVLKDPISLWSMLGVGY